MHRPAVVVAVAGLLVAACSQDILDREQKLYSQHDEELVVRDFFDDRRGGFYVDVGAFEPRTYSTTAYLAEYLDWRGIAIDAQPWLAEVWRTMRPSAKFFNYIVTDHSGGTETLYLAGPISSVTESHAGEFDVDPLGEVAVETITLNDLLDREGVTEVDFLSMDIEQGEPKALAGFDIRRFRPELVCVEAWPGVRPALKAYFAENGYVRIEKYRDRDPNWWFKPAGAPGPD